MSDDSLNRPTDCGDEQTWHRFVAGQLPELQITSLRAHAETCSVCQAVVQRLSQSGSPSSNGSGKTAQPVGDLSRTKLFQKEGHVPENAVQFELDEAEFDESLLTKSDRSDSIGKLGKYDILAVLGTGAFGVVLKAFDEQLRRSVAIKILNRQFASSATARRRFIREARAAAAVAHPCVVGIHAVEEQAGMPFLVMELVTGPSLKERIAELGKLPPIEVIRLGAQIAAGLAAAHAQGVVHRDIKPGNIMLEKSLDRVRITDFGLARVAVDNVELTSRGMAIGTPAYMAPEQVTGDAVDARSDLFALGCVLSAALVGHSPFQGRSALEMARRICEYDPVPLHTLDPAIPQFLSDLVERLLKKKPDDRYQSAAEVAALLNRYLIALNLAPSDKFQTVLNQPLSPGPASTTAVVAPQRRFAGIVPVVMAVVVLAIGVGLWQWNQREPKKNNPPDKVPVLGNDEKSAEPITPSAPQELTVSQSGEAQFQTLNEALMKATPQTTIRVLDEATYRENLEINGARFAGLQLIAEKGARLAPADPDKQSQHLLQITQVNDLLFKGWKIDAPKHGHAIYLFQAGNITLDELLIEQPPEVGAFGAIQIHAMRSSPDGFLEIKNCHVKTTGEAHCVLIYATSEPPSEIRLIGNRFERRSSDGTNVVVHLALSGNATLAKLVLGQNLFIGGGRALDLQLSGRLPAQSVDVVNNTFFQSKNWLAFDTMQANEPIARFANNLIIGGERISSLQLEEASRTWKFRTNWWERGPSTDLDPGRGGMIAESKAEGSLRFLSRDPNHKDFLHPAPDADWLESGLGGEEPKFLGAFGPVPAAPH